MSRSRGGFWLGAALIHLSLIYSTSLHMVHGPEATIGLTWFADSPNQTRGLLKKRYPDMGAVAGARIHYRGADAWKLAGTPSDIAFYLSESSGQGVSIAPYRYRVLPTFAAGLLARLTGVAVPSAFLLLNALSILCTALVFTWYLMRRFRFGPAMSLLGGVLFTTMVSNTRTVAFPMLEPLSMLFCMGAFFAASERRPFLFLGAAIGGVLTKEVLVVTGFLWLLHAFDARGRVSVWDVIIAGAPAMAFVGVRMALGGAALDVNYDYNAMEGELPEYWRRLTSVSGIAGLVTRSFLSFGFLWLGLLQVRRYRWLAWQSLLVPAVLLAAFVLSGQITRVLGVLFPVVIPAFLLWFEPRAESSNSLRVGA